jgi:Adenovirus endoprotease
MASGMSNLQLESFLRQTGCRDGRFRVVAADELTVDHAIPLGHVRICNTRKRASDGEHWVLWYVGPNEQTLNYFDPLGDCSLDHYNFPQFVSNYEVLVSNDGVPVQHPDHSNTCGLHCAYVAHLFCDYKDKYTSLEQVMRKYDVSNTWEGVNKNECKTLLYLTKRFVKYSNVFNRLEGCKV